MLFLQTGSESKVQWGKSVNHRDQSVHSPSSNRPLRGLIRRIHLNSDLQHIANFRFKNIQFGMHTNKKWKWTCKALQSCKHALSQILMKYNTHTYTSCCPPANGNIWYNTSMLCLQHNIKLITNIYLFICKRRCTRLKFRWHEKYLFNPSYCAPI